MSSSNYNIREILAAGGVILSLAFVGVELQQNTNAITATAITDYYSSAREQYSMIADPEMARIAIIVFNEPDKLTDEEAQAYFGLLMASAFTTQGAYRLWTMDVLPDEEWESALKTTCPGDNAQFTPIFQTWWNRVKPQLLPSFVETVESACGAYSEN